MRTVRIIGYVLLCLVVVLPAYAGGRTETQSNVIGISKIVSHPALDAVEQGIMDELAELGFADLTFDLQNANGDISTASSIANKFRADRVRLAVGIATPTAQALVNTLTEIPVVYATITDPVAAGLVDSFDRGGTNVTGVSDMTQVRAQIEMLSRLTDLRTIGHVYASGEANAVTLANMARDAARELGIDFVEATVTNSAEVRQATQSIVGRVDGLYVSTDNTVVSALSALVDVATAAGVPVMSADPSSAEDHGVLVAWGFDYYKMGRAAGRIVAQVLDGTPTADIPTLFMTDPSDIDLLINLDVAHRLGISVPQDILVGASAIVENGALRRQ